MQLAPEPGIPRFPTDGVPWWLMFSPLPDDAVGYVGQLVAIPIRIYVHTQVSFEFLTRDVVKKTQKRRKWATDVVHLLVTCATYVRYMYDQQRRRIHTYVSRTWQINKS